MRGTEKRIIYVHHPEGRFFEGAIFLLREPDGSAEGDVVREANRILSEGEESRAAGRRARQERPLRLLYFALGLAVSAAAILLLQTII